MSKVEDFLTAEEEHRIIEAIRTAEKTTSGEIRVHIENSATLDALTRVKELFYLLKMDNTKEANGILFYVAIETRSFAIYGDKGIDERVPENFWKSIIAILEKHFKKSEFTLGLVNGIIATGNQLQKHFPWTMDNKNELKDEISKG